MNSVVKILCIEDDELDYTLIVNELERSSLSLLCQRLETQEELARYMVEDRPQLVISDNDLPGFNGLDAQKLVQRYDKELPFILVSGTIDEVSAVQAMRSGAKDYILKDNMSRLLPAVEREIQEYESRVNQRRNQKQLIISELRYKFLAESIQEIFFGLDHNLCFTYWNSTAEKVFEKSDVLGHAAREAFPEWKRNKLINSIEHTLSYGIAVPIKFTIHSDKKEHFKGKAYPSDDGVSVILSNVTEETENKNELLRINQELETLLYRISHDFKGPVASVMGLLNIAERDENFVRADFVNMMRENIQRLNETMTELLDISHIKFGNQKNQNFKVLPILEEIKLSLGFLNRRYPAEIQFNVDPQMQLSSNVMLFKSIWQNLVENAIKYRLEDGQTSILVDAENQENGILFRITDTGQGISPEVRNKIFKMFFRGNENSTGSGLGLYIVKSALNRLGGYVKLDKNYIEGARFTVFIPHRSEASYVQLNQMSNAGRN